MECSPASDIDDQLRYNIKLAYGRKTVRFAQPVDDDDHPHHETPVLDAGSLVMDLESWMEQVIDFSPKSPALIPTLYLLPALVVLDGLDQLLIEFGLSELLSLTRANVNDLPLKRVYDPETGLVRELPKLRRDFDLDDKIAQCIFKVKLAGINFQTDFHSIASRIVPGLRIVGRIYDTNTAFDCDQKYVVYPISTCLHQNIPDPCTNCSHLGNLQVLGQLSLDKFDHYRCHRLWIYGLTIDGGLQDYLKLYYPQDSLVAIPHEVLLHDACFMFDRSLPFYVVLKQLCSVGGGQRALIVLGDVDREINDILVVLNHFGIDQRQFVFIDTKAIAKLDDDERRLYRRQFSQVFVFEMSSRLLQFVHDCLSNSRERKAFIFDQMSPIETITNTGFQHFRLGYANKADAIELMAILSNLNTVNYSYHSEQESPETASDSLVCPKSSRRQAWLNYDMDVDLRHDYNESRPMPNTHTSRHINLLIQRPKYKRVCYKTRSTNPTKIHEVSNVIIL